VNGTPVLASFQPGERATTAATGLSGINDGAQGLLLRGHSSQIAAGCFLTGLATVAISLQSRRECNRAMQSSNPC
jgi:hypothetical protein